MEQIEKTLKTIKFLCENTEWAKKTSCKEMLQLVYEECLELDKSISSANVQSIIEEAADVNMMLAYFCFKDGQLPYIDILDVFIMAKNRIEKPKNLSLDIRETYIREIKKQYLELIACYEHKAKSFEQVAQRVLNIIMVTLKLTLVFGENKERTVDQVFLAIERKLMRRYSVYLKESGKASVPDQEEDNWRMEKEMEKDIPYYFCNNPQCKFLQKFDCGNVEIECGKIICQNCKSTVDKKNALFYKLMPADRRKTMEWFESRLILFKETGNYSNVNSFLDKRFQYGDVEKCLYLFASVCRGEILINYFLTYFSEKYYLEQETVRNFLRSCFIQAFDLKERNGIKRKVRVSELKQIYTNYPDEFVYLTKAIEITSEVTRHIIFSAIEWLYLDKPMPIINGRIDKNNVMRIDVAKYGITAIICSMRYLVDRESSHEIEICFVGKNGGKGLMKYEKLFYVLFVDGSSKIRRICYGDEN